MSWLSKYSIRLPPVLTIPQLARLSEMSIYQTHLTLQTNNVPVYRRGKVRIVFSSSLETHAQDWADTLRMRGGGGR